MNVAIRNAAFDQVKGVLMVAVIVGHVALGSLQESSLRSFIYFFHMPLFLGIAGYFVKPAILNYSVLDICKKYWVRLLVPFLFAALVYSVLFGRVVISIYPYYHFWYIPAVLLFVFYLKWLRSLLQSNPMIFILVLFLFLAISIYFETNVQWRGVRQLFI